MKPLSKELRNKFERTIENAREVAEEAAKIALEQLGVGEASPYSYLSEDERALRRRLRAHGRNLGDIRDSKTETQEIDRLVEEIAYEHWHRMLFARFLAENDLLMYYEDDDIENAVPVTLSECDELAEELGLINGWEMAAKLATKMLPQVFRADSPVFKIGLSPEKQRQLENLVSNIENDVFKASDSLGWAYQFWQSKKKSEINNNGNKVGDKELPVVTQLFTEPYMVDYLIDNSLGAWWANVHLKKRYLSDEISEIDLQKKISLPNLSFDYLKFEVDDSNYWFAPGFDSTVGWPESLSELKVIDPASGSGHFIVSIFLKLVPLRMEIEKISAEKACDLVIEENIHGLEIDQRCIEIAAFALALAAWKYPNAGGFRKLPSFNIAWCGQAINVKKEEFIKLSGGVNSLELHLETMYELFKKAPILGSLINPLKTSDNISIFDDDQIKINELIINRYNFQKNDVEDLSVVAKGIEKAYRLLSEKYHWVITNVPYLGRSKMNDSLKEYLSKEYSIADKDLALAMIERSFQFLKENGVLQFVTSSNWTFLKRYEEYRTNLLKDKKWIMYNELGYKAFTTSMYDFPVSLISIINNKPNDHKFSYLNIDKYEDKPTNLKKKRLIFLIQEEQLKNPDSRIMLKQSSSKSVPLGQYAYSKRGIVNGDNEKWLRNFWEINNNSSWEYIQGSPSKADIFSGRSQVIDWASKGNGMLRPGLANETYGNYGIAITRIKNLHTALYTGEFYDQNAAVIVPYNPEHLEALWCYCNSNDFKRDLLKLDKKLGITPATFTKVEIELDKWILNAKTEFPNGLPKPYSDDPTQWIFHGHPRKSADPLQVAVARLMGYRWPAELDEEMELSNEAKALVEECEGLLSFADKDGIVCIPSVRGEAPASERLLNLLAAAYKDEDINMILPGLLSDVDHAGKSLESWLRDKFFTQHYKLFGLRPFIWQIWDGLKDGFSALVNYHKLDRKNLETLIYTYLGDWISKQKSAMVEGIEGAEEKLNAATSLKKKLELILEGEAPYDIFVRWKPLNKQPLGWEPDLNDGVRINIRPFMSVGDVGKKGAGILRDKPNIKWTKDRGKDTENSPWYHLFGGDRINDHHLTREEKKKAREEMR